MSSDITTLSGLYTEITRLLDGEDPTVSDISTATLNRLLKIAQRRIYRETRTRYNEVAFTGLTSTANAVPLPADFEDAAHINVGKLPLLPISRNQLQEKLQNQCAGDAVYFARVVSTLMFEPALTDGTAVLGSYYARLPDLSDATGNFSGNALFQAADDLFIYGCLVESGPFFDNPQRMPIWEAKYASILGALNGNDMTAAYSAGRMRVSTSTKVIR